MKLFVFIALCFVAATANGRSVDPDSFISNGQNSRNPPFFVYLEIFENDNHNGTEAMFFGGGTLITTTLVLTVAQNVYEFNSWRAGCGSNRIKYMSWFNSTDAIVHPGYDNGTLSNNIAIIRLAQATPNNAYIAPAYLIAPGATFPNAGTQVSIYGFGFPSADVRYQPVYLQTLSVTVILQNECLNRYPHLQNDAQIANHFCARNNQITQSNICAGDQGGPAFVENVNFVVALQSFYRVEDCTSEYAQPAAFIRISPYMGWINSVFQAYYELDSTHTIQEHLNL